MIKHINGKSTHQIIHKLDAKNVKQFKKNGKKNNIISFSKTTRFLIILNFFN